MPIPIRPLTAALALALTGCAAPLTPEAFTATAPAFAPERYFEGTTSSFGVFETTDAEPRSSFTTRARGTRLPGGDLRLVQDFTYDDGKRQQRVWLFHPEGGGRYTATANDVIGTARGEARGRLFHWTYTVRTPEGSPVETVDLEQWMYLQDDGRTVLNRGVARKFGVAVRSLAESFTRERPVR